MRTKNRRDRILAIFVSDMHLRETAPECRKDDFLEAQTKKLRWLSKLQVQNNCPVLVAGDLFDYWKPSPWLLAYALRELPSGIIAIPGQHDLPAHSLEQIEKSGIQVLADAGKIDLLLGTDEDSCDINGMMYQGFPWGVELKGTDRGFGESIAIALVHKLIYKAKELPFPGADEVGYSVRGIVKQLPGFNIIITGDNHQTIFAQVNDTIVVNCGSFMRTTAAQADHEPSVFLLHENFNVTQLKIPISKDVISREHIDRKKQKETRISAFAERLNKRVEIGLSFEHNLKKVIRKNNISKAVQSKVWEVLDGCKDRKT